MMTREEKLLQRFRHMMTNSGAAPPEVSDVDLLKKLVGNTHEEKMASAEAVLSLVPESYWQRVEQLQ